MKSLLTAIFVILLSSAFLPGNKHMPASLDNLLTVKTGKVNNGPVYDGHIVDYESAVRCIALFEPEMRNYNITSDTPRQKVNGCPALTRMVSTAEWFDGDNLLNYFAMINKTYNPSGKKGYINYRLQYGILDQPFIEEYVTPSVYPWASSYQIDSLKRVKLFRIVSFVMPYVADNVSSSSGGKKMINRLDEQSNHLPGYELGGIQP